MKIYKTKFVITVLSDGPVNFNGGDNDPFDLREINYAITEGDCLGQVERVSQEEVPADKVESESIALGNDGSFF